MATLVWFVEFVLLLIPLAVSCTVCLLLVAGICGVDLWRWLKRVFASR
jgi:hypothetical protein